MAGNSFGQQFRITSFGESHGPCIGGVIDGCPAGLRLDKKTIDQALARRRPGFRKNTSPRKESDEVQFWSGLLDGITTGAPIGFTLDNQDPRSEDYAAHKGIFRPGHGDYAYQEKYGIWDHRGGGRASARETAIRVVGGAVAQQCLARVMDLTLRACVVQIGAQPHQGEIDWHYAAQSPISAPNATTEAQWQRYLEQLIHDRDAAGALIRVEALGVPAGLGEPVYDKLSADLAKGWMSINAVKGVAIGDGFQVVTQRSSAHRDALTPEGFQSNHAGGILAGISTGMPIVGHLAFKPTSSIQQPIDSCTVSGAACTVSVSGRHDPCVAVRAPAIVEAMTALVLLDHALRCYGLRAFQPTAVR